LITAQFVSLAIESNERIKLQQKLEETLREKENFLKETFHRVKNNLSVISSLVNLQKSKIHVPEAIDQLEELSNRIQSISSLHDLLHKSQQFDTVNMHDYLELILQNLVQTASYNIEINNLIDPVILKSDQGILVGMIANELVTNAIKHAFNEIDEAKLTVLLTEKNGNRTLTITDNGKGIESCLSSASFGINILDGLVEQLNGKIEYINQDGLSVRLTF
jgi:two-component sensor histidine kinase